MERLFNVGAYIRLSVEDAVYDSDSIENQREMLSLFIDQMPGWILHHCYVDNGFSGANFQRPAFQEMMLDVRCGKVNLVLVKDLSRFGRNYLEAGRYLEEELPALGCRFVALSDGIDTETGENDIMPFLNAMNDYYLKNLSDRIRSVLHAKARDGQKLGRTPYGFCRAPENHTRLIVDEYAAAVVRRIYEMRRDGMGFFSIVKTLNAESIPSPMVYRQINQQESSSRTPHKKWINCTVHSILHNELYIGTAVQLKNKMVSYRERREVRCPEEEWVRVENAFPAIIDRETWNAVQEVNRQASRPVSKGQAGRKNLFTGLLVCPDCGGKMTTKHTSYTSTAGEKTAHLYYACRTHSATSGAACSSHNIAESELKELLLGEIRHFATQVALDENAMLKLLTQRLIGTDSVSKADTKKEARRLGQELHKLQTAMSKLYEDWATGAVSESGFSAQMQRYEADRQTKEHRLSLLEQTEQDAAAKLADINHWMSLIREYANSAELDRRVLDSLVEKVEVGQRGADRKVRIHYRFVGEL